MKQHKNTTARSQLSGYNFPGEETVIDTFSSSYRSSQMAFTSRHTPVNTAELSLYITIQLKDERQPPQNR